MVKTDSRLAGIVLAELLAVVLFHTLIEIKNGIRLKFSKKIARTKYRIHALVKVWVSGSRKREVKPNAIQAIQNQ